VTRIFIETGFVPRNVRDYCNKFAQAYVPSPGLWPQRFSWMGSRDAVPPSLLKEDIHLFNKLRSHLNFANVVAMCALFVALSGTSYAVKKIGAKDIRKNAVRAKHIKRNGVASSEIKNRSIRPIDIAASVTGKTLESSAGQARRDAGPTGVAASTNFTPVATMNGLQPGAYVLLAKVNQSANIKTEGRCRLQAGDDYDDSNTGLREGGTPHAHTLQLVHAFTGPGSVVLACRSAHGVWAAADAKIIVIKVGSASSNIVGG
jgi:hypothetical protein